MTGLETGLLIALCVVALLLLCTCYCCCKAPGDGDHLTGAQRRAIMKGKEPPPVDGVEYKSVLRRTPRNTVQHVQEWVPKEPKAVVCYCHGFADNAMWLPWRTAQRFAKQGYSVYLPDHMGHGQSDGMLVLIENFQTLVDDAAAYIKDVRARNPGLKVFVYGESMGGAIALYLHLRFPELLDGAILSAPMAKLAPEMFPPCACCVIPALRSLSRRWPTLAATPTQDVLDAAFKDDEMRALARANPVALTTKIRIATAREMLDATLSLATRLHEVSLPFLVLHGCADTVTHPAVSQDLYDQAKSQDKTFKKYDGMWHALTIAEPPESIERVFKDIFDWLGARCGSTNATTGASTGAGAGAGAGTGVTGAAVVSPTPQGETVSMPGRANTASDVLVDVRTA